MRTTDNPGFVAALKSGDIGIISSDNFFAKLQALYAHRFKEGPYRASHGFILTAPPKISEANGLFVGSATILKDIGDKTKCWVFRYSKATDAQVQLMLSGAALSEETSGHYSIGGILQFAKAFISGKRDEKEETGVFCTEYTSRLIIAAGIKDYISSIPPWQIDPTYQLNWFMADGPKAGWDLIGHYDGEGNYFIGG